MHKINKMILTRNEEAHGKHELLGPFDRYNSENYEIYKEKRKDFLDRVKAYREENLKVLGSRKTRLGYDPSAPDPDPEEAPEEKAEEDNSEPVLLHKRSLRRVNDVFQEASGPCSLDKWFYRYQVLGKFITAVRKIIIINRMLKRLPLLKDKDKIANDSDESEIINVTYGELFKKFITKK